MKFKKTFALLLVGALAMSMMACAADSNYVLNADTNNENSVLSSAETEEGNSPIILQNVTQAKNVILMIGDGMGPNKLKRGKFTKAKH